MNARLAPRLFCLSVLLLLCRLATAQDVVVPMQIVQVYLILQAPGEPVDGSSSTLDVVTRDKFVADFERYGVSRVRSG
jgi:hypothetical protein